MFDPSLGFLARSYLKRTLITVFIRRRWCNHPKRKLLNVLIQGKVRDAFKLVPNIVLRFNQYANCEDMLTLLMFR